ncbi:MAG: peptidylprolyl isomerase [Alcanivorax sp.]|jgi:peptidyl-prolyl cis-trans isomerase A (cyclophilin A)|nr:MAG: peptidylprolyl isomerase A [Oceanobacter sp.]|tara:strand:+ start:5066 stop:5656 length:591 start_codon:yes stop_codon:yes gene_type:complete
MRIIAIALLSMFTALSSSLTHALDETVNIGLNTSEGYIEFELNKTKAPLSVENFIAYVESDHYDGTIFHRVIKNFMVQGGGFNVDMTQRATQPAIKNEAKNGLKNKRGSIAMARTSSVDSATSQFFVNVKDNSFLDHGVRDYGYAVFGRVVQGMEIIDRISQVPTGARDIPRNPITIYDAKVIDKAAQESGNLLPN